MKSTSATELSDAGKTTTGAGCRFAPANLLPRRPKVNTQANVSSYLANHPAKTLGSLEWILTWLEVYHPDISRAMYTSPDVAARIEAAKVGFEETVGHQEELPWPRPPLP